MAPRLENRVFRGAVARASGPVPFSIGEAIAAIVIGVPTGAVGGRWLGAVVVVVVLAGLIAWRRHDHNRRDYARARLRRSLWPSRRYNPAEPDVGEASRPNVEDVRPRPPTRARPQ